MAVKASAQITISKVIDVYAVYRYYKLQSSTLTKPSKPTVNPPSDWSDTEPTYVSGSTSTLYFVDCNVYSDKTFSFSEVSISSSYEAAKDAWNKAQNALKTADAAIATVDVEYYLSSSSSSLSGGSWSTTAPTWVNGKYMWSRTVTIDGAGNKTYSPSQNGVCIAGAQGNTGAAGKGVKSIEERYYKSTSATFLSGGSWTTTYPGWENGKYIWTRSIITYTDTTSTTTTAVCVTGEKGEDGKGVKFTEIDYQASTSGTTVPTGTWQSTIPSVEAGSYLWTRTIITYTDTTTSISYSVSKMGDTGTMGETLSNGKLLYKDIIFADGLNGITVYNNSSGENVMVTRQAKSTDNPCGDFELLIQNTGAASPGIGGFKWAHDTRANAVFIYRIIAKIPTGRSLCWASNNAGGVTVGKFLTSNSGTGEFTEYIYKFKCGASGSFSETGYFYLNGSAGTTSSPVKWYVAYAGVWDMTDYEEMLSKEEAKDTYTTQLEMSKTNEELRFDFNKSISSAADDLQSQIKNNENQTEVKFNQLSRYIRFVDGKIVLGELNNELVLTIQNDRVSFTQAGTEVAYFSNNKLHIRKAEVLTTLKVGNYEFTPRNDGGLALRKRGD